MRGVYKDEDGFFITVHEAPRYLIESRPRLWESWRRADTRQDYFYSHQESQGVESQEGERYNWESYKVVDWGC